MTIGLRSTNLGVMYHEPLLNELRESQAVPVVASRACTVSAAGYVPK